MPEEIRLNEGGRVHFVTGDGKVLVAELTIMHRGVGIVRLDCGRTEVLPLPRIHSSIEAAGIEAVEVLRRRAAELLDEHRDVVAQIAKWRYAPLDSLIDRS